MKTSDLDRAISKLVIYLKSIDNYRIIISKIPNKPY